MFYYKNVWGISKEELEELDEVNQTSVGDLMTFMIHPPDSERFTVAAVNKEVFEYLRVKTDGGDDEDTDYCDLQPNPYRVSWD